MASLMELLIISLNTILQGVSRSIPSRFARCHEIASPSRSGSVARYTFDAFFASFLSSLMISPFASDGNVLWFEIVLDIDAKLAFGQVPHMPDRSDDLIVCTKILANGFGL